MPSSTSSSSTPVSGIDATSTAAAGHARLSTSPEFKVVPFRRAANGTLVPGALMAFTNGDIAWRRARAAASEHGNVGAVELRDGAVLARFGDVDLNALPH